jgi:DNA-binding CsgD family transcriptional regulator
MFIPRTAPLYENLATSFVLVDALIDDLGEGGFSGVVEIVLRDSDCRIVIAGGRVLSATEAIGQTITPVSIAAIAEKSKVERGRVSIYRSSDDSAEAIAKRMVASSLYSRLSTEFADLDKMISKLRRELDREWFIEIDAESGISGLVHLKGRFVHTVTSDTATAEGDQGLKKLLEECKAHGGSFDVYFALPAQAAAALRPVESPPRIAPAAPEPKVSEAETPRETPAAIKPAPMPEAEEREAALQAAFAEIEQGRKSQIAASASVGAHHAESASASSLGDTGPLFTLLPDEPLQPVPLPAVGDTSLESPFPDLGPASPLKNRRIATADLTEAEAMIEVKRMMGEIASAVENAIRQIESRNTFSMYLRAGQLKIADRYPFLDPFGNEFEYHAGEVAFVGKEKPEVFVEGFTEALRLAVISVVEVSPQPDRLRSRIREDLSVLAEKMKAELQEFGLDESIRLIAG